MSVKLDVSLGEALDKLSILDIKKNKINDNRLQDILLEFNYLHDELQYYIDKYKYLYGILYKTNLRIWDCMDIIRNSNKTTAELYEYIDETIVLNDSRYLVKKKINEVCNSKLKEQKGYNIRRINIILNCDIDTINILNGAIRYYSFFYDEVNLFSSDENIMYLNNTFDDDPFININCLEKAYSEFSINDCVSIDNICITLKLLHSFFNKHNNSENHIYYNTYSKEVNDIYSKLGMNVTIFDDYTHFSTTNK